MYCTLCYLCNSQGHVVQRILTESQDHKVPFHVFHNDRYKEALLLQEVIGHFVNGDTPLDYCEQSTLYSFRCI